MFSCPKCHGRISIWHGSNDFACPSCGAELRTNGLAVHLVANALAGFGAMAFLFMPEIECSPLLEMSVLLIGYTATYAAFIWLFFGVELHEKTGP